MWNDNHNDKAHRGPSGMEEQRPFVGTPFGGTSAGARLRKLCRRVGLITQWAGASLSASRRVACATRCDVAGGIRFVIEDDRHLPQMIRRVSMRHHARRLSRRMKVPLPYPLRGRLRRIVRPTSNARSSSRSDLKIRADRPRRNTLNGRARGAGPSRGLPVPINGDMSFMHAGSHPRRDRMDKSVNCETEAQTILSRRHNIEEASALGGELRPLRGLLEGCARRFRVMSGRTEMMMRLKDFCNKHSGNVTASFGIAQRRGASARTDQ
jgi:hypothetical protein